MKEFLNPGGQVEAGPYRIGPGAGGRFEGSMISTLTFDPRHGTSDQAAKITLETLRLIRQEHAGCRIMCIAATSALACPPGGCSIEPCHHGHGRAWAWDAVMIDVRDRP